MKIGIDSPWYNDPIERMAFNLYALHQSELDDAINRIIHNGETSINFSFDLSTADEEYIRMNLAAAGIDADISFN